MTWQPPFLQNVDRIRGKEEIDLTCDPPPDLAVEVEISRRALPREGVYARLQVPELWKDIAPPLLRELPRSGGGRI